MRFGDSENLVDGVIAYSLMEDHKGNIWCGTSGGIYVYDVLSDEVVHYSSEDGLPNDVVCGLCEDDSRSINTLTVIYVKRMKGSHAIGASEIYYSFPVIAVSSMRKLVALQTVAGVKIHKTPFTDYEL